MNNIITTLKANITNDKISETFYIKSNSGAKVSSNTEPKDEHQPLLVIKFKDAASKTELMLKKKQNMQNLFSNQIGFNDPGESQIFIRHHFTHFRQFLFRETRKIKQEFKFKYLWYNNSKIFIRKDEKSKVPIHYQFTNRFIKLKDSSRIRKVNFISLYIIFNF